MPKVVLIGAGSWVFTRSIVRDMLAQATLEGMTLALVDIDPERLDMARRVAERVVEAGGYRTEVVCSIDRREVLADADAVLITILSGGADVFQHDILIPKKYGVDVCVGDTRGPAGIFRALRTIPEMLAICRDVERLCPRAVVLNYTNPMAMLCHAMQRESSANVTGLCHSVQGTARRLARWVDVPEDEIDYVCAGLNHLGWYLQLEHRGRDLYPALRKVVATDPDVYNEEQVRNELFLQLGYYVTESSGHNSEYNWWFRKRPDLIEKFCTRGTGWNPGVHAAILNEYRKRSSTWRQEFADWIEKPDWSDADKRSGLLQPGHEYAASILNAWLGGGMFRFNGNVPNTGVVTNLPQGACVEVPVVASRGRLEAVHVGALPLPVVPLTALTATVEQMAVEACLSGDPELVYRAVANDPLTAAVLSLAEIRAMVREMFAINREHLPHFPSVSI